jgi:outer membrane protein assembly factor BamA
MLCNRIYFLGLVVIIFLCKSVPARAQADKLLLASAYTPFFDSLYVIGDIDITGNIKTKESIILREISIKKGEAYTISDLVKKFEYARRQLMNTALFQSAIVAAQRFEGNTVFITVIVKERWYLFPIPYLKPVDRNLNQWVVEQKASLKRINFGGKLLYNNASGRNDKLRVWLIGGYTKQVTMSYDRLYFDKKMKWGARFGFSIGKNHEMNYNTIDDKQVFLKDNNRYLRNFSNTFFELTYRRAIKTRHSFGIAYTTEKVMDTVIHVNPEYFNRQKNKLLYPEIYYNLVYYDLDYIPYPTKGYAADIYVGKKGFNRNMNVWHLSAKALGSWRIMPGTFFSTNIYGAIRLPFKQPFYNQRFLGYNDIFMQGYEYNVIDGVAGGYIKATVSRELVNFKIRIPPAKKGKEAIYIPFRIFGKIFGNTGYVYNPQPGENRLPNSNLFSGGLGIDIVSFYDVTFKLDWTFNQLGQNGIYFHRKSIF